MNGVYDLIYFYISEFPFKRIYNRLRKIPKKEENRIESRWLSAKPLSRPLSWALNLIPNICPFTSKLLRISPAIIIIEQSRSKVLLDSFHFFPNCHPPQFFARIRSEKKVVTIVTLCENSLDAVSWNCSAIKARFVQIVKRGRPCRTLEIFSHHELFSLVRLTRLPPSSLKPFTLGERDARFILGKKIASNEPIDRSKRHAALS